MRWEDKVEFAPATDVGLRRSNNQDSWAVHMASDREAWEYGGHLFIVADGMGAHAVGELASKMAVDTIPLNYQKHPDLDPAEALRQAVEEANGSIYKRGHENREFAGMGTTVSVLALHRSGAVIGHVGDSRVYRVRGEVIEQLTFDHSLSWELMRQGKVREELARQLPSNVIVRSLGPEPRVEVDIEGPFEIEQGDVYVLCSDGLSGQVSDEEIGVLAGSVAPQEAVRILVDLANLRGGPDNITVLAARVGQAEPAGPPDAKAKPAGGGLRRLWRKLAGSSKSKPATQNRFGNAPYRTYPCSVTERQVLELATLENQLRLTAVEDVWKVNWSGFFANHQRAESLVRDGKCNEALVEYGRAVGFLMRGLQQRKAWRPPGASESTKKGTGDAVDS